MTSKLNSLKEEILGKKYELSISSIPSKKSHELNLKWRGKDKPTNVLAFPLSPTSGEILLCPAVIRKEAKSFHKTPKEFEFFLVIHGMLHLKGMEHGSIMESKEDLFFQKYFYTHGKKHFNRNRRRIRLNSSGGGRVSKRRT